MNTPAKVLPANHAWKISESLDLYQVEAWGKGYFTINGEGHVVVRPSMDAAREIDLYEVVQGLKARDLHTPVVIRFSDILAHRLRHIADAFGRPSRKTATRTAMPRFFRSRSTSSAWSSKRSTATARSSASGWKWARNPSCSR